MPCPVQVHCTIFCVYEGESHTMELHGMQLTLIPELAGTADVGMSRHSRLPSRQPCVFGSVRSVIRSPALHASRSGRSTFEQIIPF